MAKVNILSIDGGGIKGIVSALVLEKIEELIQLYTKNSTANIADYFDMIGGTSTGSIITALLVCPNEVGRPKYRAKDIVDMYQNHAKDIFQKKKSYPLNTLFGAFGSKYSNQQFAVLLEKYFGDLLITDLLKDSMYTSYNTYNRQAVFFSTISGASSKPNEYRLRDVVLASTAAPTYFPPVNLPGNGSAQDCYIDGGVIANNPALCLLIESLKIPNHTDICDTMLLSIGNVSNPTYYPYNKVKRWGYAGWAAPILNILLEGGEESASYEVEKIFKSCHIASQYMRIELQTKHYVPGMDCVSEKDLQILFAYGEELVHLMEPKLKNYVKQLISYK